MGLSHSPRIVTDGLVLCLDAANKRSYPGAGTTWTDLTANKNNGTLTNMDSSNFSSDGGGSFIFDGASDYIVGDSSLDIITSNLGDTLTCEAWIKTSSTSDYDGVVYFGTNLCSMYVCSDGGFSIQSNGDNAGTCPSNSYIADGNWHHIVTQYNEGSRYLGYLDGYLAFSIPTSDIENTTTTVYEIGRRNNTSADCFNGSIGLVHIYNRILTAQEIKQNYLATKGRFQ